MWSMGGRSVKDLPYDGGRLGGARDDDRTAGVMYDVITDAAEDRAAYLAESARTHHDVAGLLACRHIDDELSRLLKVRDEFAPQLRKTKHRPIKHVVSL